MRGGIGRPAVRVRSDLHLWTSFGRRQYNTGSPPGARHPDFGGGVAAGLLHRAGEAGVARADSDNDETERSAHERHGGRLSDSDLAEYLRSGRG